MAKKSRMRPSNVPAPAPALEKPAPLMLHPQAWEAHLELDLGWAMTWLGESGIRATVRRDGSGRVEWTFHQPEAATWPATPVPDAFRRAFDGEGG